MRILVLVLAASSMLLAGCTSMADVERDPATFSSSRMSVNGEWDQTFEVQVGSDWRSLVAFLDLDGYTGNWDFEFIHPDGTIRDTCGDSGCNANVASNQRREITSGLGGDEAAMAGTWIVHGWGSGVGSLVLGIDALVPR